MLNRNLTMRMILIFGSYCRLVSFLVSLQAFILVAIIPLMHLKNILHLWCYDRGDCTAETVTLLGVLILGIEKGIAFGIILTLVNQLRKISHPHTLP